VVVTVVSIDQMVLPSVMDTADSRPLRSGTNAYPESYADGKAGSDPSVVAQRDSKGKVSVGF
jgi:hypothetical protein